MQQLRQLFVMESQDTLQNMEDSILQLEKNSTDADAIKVLFRSAHTIKGSAGVVGLDEVSRFTHVMENVLDRVRNHICKQRNR
jgi:two-component system chemotaxis sensor kinase CheA